MSDRDEQKPAEAKDAAWDSVLASLCHLLPSAGLRAVIADRFVAYRPAGGSEDRYVARGRRKANAVVRQMTGLET
jgi:hypothetical protein